MRIIANRDFKTLGITLNRGDVMPSGLLPDSKVQQLLNQRWLVAVDDSGGDGADEDPEPTTVSAGN